MQMNFAERITWPALPSELRAQIESVLGSEVVDSRSQTGGFSPGTADRIVTADGRRAFVKAVSRELNEGSANLHVREAKIAASLHSSLPVPRFIGHQTWENWEALIFSDIDGCSPKLPWNQNELLAVLDVLAGMTREPLDVGEIQLPELFEDVREDFQGFRRLMSDGYIPEDPWVAANTAELNELAQKADEALAGDQLVHSDLRSDNLLIDTSGEIILVDWPWATRGAAWYDGLTVLIEAKIFNPDFDADRLIASHELFNGVASEAVDAVLAGLAGFYVDAARRPPIPSLPTLRDYHAKQASATVAWLKGRLDSRSRLA